MNNAPSFQNTALHSSPCAEAMLKDGYQPTNIVRHCLAPDSLQRSLSGDLCFGNHPTHFQSSSKSLIASFFLPCFSLKLAASLISDKWTGDFG